MIGCLQSDSWTTNLDWTKSLTTACKMGVKNKRTLIFGTKSHSIQVKSRVWWKPNNSPRSPKLVNLQFGRQGQRDWNYLESVSPTMENSSISGNKTRRKRWEFGGPGLHYSSKNCHRPSGQPPVASPNLGPETSLGKELLPLRVFLCGENFTTLGH